VIIALQQMRQLMRGRPFVGAVADIGDVIDETGAPSLFLVWSGDPHCDRGAVH
jgi:hypothetical protein